MTHDLASLKAALAGVPAVAVQARLVRIVAFHELTKYNPPDWLYKSDKPRRYNPAGIKCIYFAETREVAQAEYDGMWNGTPAMHQPITLFYAEVILQRILDLTVPATLKFLSVAEKDLMKSWRTAKRPTLTQLIGQAVSETGLFSAIRFPSAAASRGQPGVNFVIFQNCVKAPDSVCILGPTNVPLQKWP